MKKPKYSIEKAKKAVEVSSKIEGHIIPNKKSGSVKRGKAKVKN